MSSNSGHLVFKISGEHLVPVESIYYKTTSNGRYKTNHPGRSTGV